MNCLQRWKEQKPNRIHRDNRGSSLALIMSIIAVIGILGAVLLSVSLVTFRMKDTYSVSQKNFYNAESVVDAIYIGLQQDVAAATGEAYSWTLQHYEEANEETREKEYEKKFEEKLLEKLESADGISCKLNHLKDLVPSDMQENINGKASCLISVGTSGPVTLGSDAGEDPENPPKYHIDKDTSPRCYTIRDLCVHLEASRNFMSEIQTDIVLTCPKIDFTLKGSGPMDSDLTNYVFVANKETKSTGGVIQVNGNAYLGNEGANFSNCTVTFMPTGNRSSLVTAGSRGRLVTAGKFRVDKGATVQVGSSDENKLYDFWAREIYADSSKEVCLNGTIYLNNDLVIGNYMDNDDSVKVKLNGRFYAYGNPDTAKNAAVFETAARNLVDMGSHPADYSSAVLINGRNASLDLSGLDNMIIAGNAYVKSENHDTDILMGESVSVRMSQRAYLVPARYIAPQCDHGGMNPMTESVFTELCAELKKSPSSTDHYEDFLDSKEWENLQNEYEGISIERLVHTVLKSEGIENMIFFFLKFKSEAQAVEFGNKYYQGENLSVLHERLNVDHYNTNITYPSSFSFYYNGSVLVPEDENMQTTFLTGKCTTVKNTNLEDIATNYQNTFGALAHTLTTDYKKLVKEDEKAEPGTSKKLETDLYHNLVNVGEVEGLGDRKVFTTFTTDGSKKICAVVINNKSDDNSSYKLSDLLKLNEVDSNPVHLVIASGNITVDCNFDGLIIAGGTVELMSGITVSADSTLAQQALRAKHADGTTPLDYLNDGGKYLAGMGGTSSSGGVAYGLINYEDYVTYRNWKKQ